VSERKQLLLRLDPAVHDALGRWAAAELRSTTAHIEYLLRQALARAGRLPDNIGRLPRRGRPPKSAAVPGETEPIETGLIETGPGDAEPVDTQPGTPEAGAPEDNGTGTSEPEPGGGR